MAKLIVYKTSIFDAANIQMSKGQILYCADTNTYLYDITDEIRIQTKKIHYCETQEDFDGTLWEEGHVYYNYAKNILYKYSHKDIESTIELIPITTSEEMFDIFDYYDELAPTTLFQNSDHKKLAPTTIAKQVYVSDGSTVEDKLKYVTRISKISVDVIAGEENQKEFVIPFPFENYLDDPGNSFEVHIGSTIVSPERYVVNDNRILTFLEWDKGIAAGRTVTFVFWFNSSIVNESDRKLQFDGNYIINHSIPVNKLAKTSDNYLNNNPDTIPTCKALSEMYNNLSKKIEMFTFGLTGRCLTKDDLQNLEPNKFHALIPNFTLVDGSYLELHLHKPIVAGASVRVNFGQYIPIYYNNEPITSSSGYLTGSTIVLKYNGIKNRFEVCIMGRYTTVPIIYSYTATGNENIIPFELTGFVPGFHHVKVYQNNMRIFEDLNYTLDGNTIILKDYVADEGDVFCFEYDKVVDAN